MKVFYPTQHPTQWAVERIFASPTKFFGGIRRIITQTPLPEKFQGHSTVHTKDAGYRRIIFPVAEENRIQ